MPIVITRLIAAVAGPLPLFCYFAFFGAPYIRHTRVYVLAAYVMAHMFFWPALLLAVLIRRYRPAFASSHAILLMLVASLTAELFVFIPTEVISRDTAWQSSLGELLSQVFFGVGALLLYEYITGWNRREESTNSNV